MGESAAPDWAPPVVMLAAAMGVDLTCLDPGDVDERVDDVVWQIQTSKHARPFTPPGDIRAGM